MNFHTADAALDEKGERNRLTTAPVHSLTLQEQCPYEWRGSIQVYQDFAIYPLRDKTLNTVWVLNPCGYSRLQAGRHYEILSDLVRKERLDIMCYFDGDRYV